MLWIGSHRYYFLCSRTGLLSQLGHSSILQVSPGAEKVNGTHGIGGGGQGKTAGGGVGLSHNTIWHLSG